MSSPEYNIAVAFQIKESQRKELSKICKDAAFYEGETPSYGLLLKILYQSIEEGYIELKQVEGEWRFVPCLSNNNIAQEEQHEEQSEPSVESIETEDYKKEWLLTRDTSISITPGQINTIKSSIAYLKEESEEYEDRDAIIKDLESDNINNWLDYLDEVEEKINNVLLKHTK